MAAISPPSLRTALLRAASSLYKPRASLEYGGSVITASTHPSGSARIASRQSACTTEQQSYGPSLRPQGMSRGPRQKGVFDSPPAPVAGGPPEVPSPEMLADASIRILQVSPSKQMQEVGQPAIPGQ